jgi:5,10-methylenetetrahydromethanopterin reductase
MASDTRIGLACAFPPSIDVVEHARLAEELGYTRLWLYDSPALYGDIWLTLGRVAEATTTLGLGTGVAVPSLRHVMVTASAIASIEELAPGRLVAAFGTGFTARMAMGQKPMSWNALATYVTQLRALLRGDVVEVDGAACQMLHAPGFAPPRPIDVPLYLAPIGPKGFAVSREHADGVLVTGEPAEDASGAGRWAACALLVSGTVLDDGEDHMSARVREAAGPWFVTGYHAMWEWEPSIVDAMPGGPEWRSRIETERTAGHQHLAVHEGHVVTVTDRDRPLLDAAGAALLDAGWTGDRAAVGAHLEQAAAAGVTDVIYTPAGPDVPRELRAFAEAYRAAVGG